VGFGGKEEESNGWKESAAAGADRFDGDLARCMCRVGWVEQPSSERFG
jgi:hypothetical protein